MQVSVPQLQSITKDIEAIKTAKLRGGKNVDELIHSGFFVKFKVFQREFLRNY